MAYTHYYVSANNGNDSWDGTSPVYISGTTGPKATVQAGMNLIGSASGEFQINVESGTYYENSILPTYAGVSSIPNILRGDYDGSIFGTPGWVIIDAFDTINHKYSTLSGIGSVAGTTAWDYWEIIGMAVVGTGGASFRITAGGSPTLNYFRVKKCYGVSLGNVGIWIATYDFPDIEGAVTIEDSSFQSTGSSSGIYIRSSHVGSQFTNHPIVIKSSYAFSSGTYAMYSNASNAYLKIKFIDCMSVSGSNTGLWSYYGSTSLANEATFQRCLGIQGANYPPAGGFSTINYIDSNYSIGGNSQANWTQGNNSSFLISAWNLMSTSDIIDVLSSSSITAPIPTTDLFGNSRPAGGSNDWTVGAVEFVSGNELYYPTGGFPPPPAGGGKFPAFGGFIIRGKD